MTAAVLLAAAAGACAAGAIVELVLARVASTGARRRARHADAPAATGARAGAHRTAGLATALARVGRRLGVPAAPGDLGARLAAAGQPFGLRAGDVMAIKSGMAAVAVVVTLPVAAVLPTWPGVVSVPVIPAAAYLAPDLVLGARIRARRAAMAAGLADVVELLRVAVQAGLPTGRALVEVGRRAGGLLAEELGTAAARMELGVPRARALEGLVARCPLGAVAALAAAIGRADRHGAPLAPALAALAVEARAEQARLIRDRAARAAPKIQLVVALLLVPAVMLLVAAALVLALVPAG